MILMMMSIAIQPKKHNSPRTNRMPTTMMMIYVFFIRLLSYQLRTKGRTALLPNCLIDDN